MQLLLIEHKNNSSKCPRPDLLGEVSELTLITVNSDGLTNINQEYSTKVEKRQRMSHLKLFKQNRLLNAILMALLQGFITAGLEVLI